MGGIDQVKQKFTEYFEPKKKFNCSKRHDFLRSSKVLMNLELEVASEYIMYIYLVL